KTGRNHRRCRMGRCSTFIKANCQCKCATSRIGGELVDERYEFENAEYRIASIELKAIAYDVVTAISKRKTELIQKTTAKEEIENLLTELNNKSDKLLVLTNQIEESLEA